MGARNQRRWPSMTRGCRPALSENGEAVIERRTGKLNSPGNDDHFNLIEGQLSNGFGRGQRFVPNGD